MISDRCTHCQRCVRLRPMQNIHFEDNAIIFGTTCILCARCYNFCPTVAIQFDKTPGSLEKRPYQGPTPEFTPELLKK